MSKVYLITGSNTGLGLDASRQLALRETTKKVYLACRTESKALAAIEGLVKNHGISKHKLAFVPFDASADKETVAKIVESLPINEKIDSIILNAGGVGHDLEGKPAAPNNVIPIMQLNLISNVHLVETLMNNGFLKPKETSIINVGSEASRGIKIMGMPPINPLKTIDGYDTWLDGSFLKKYAPMKAYQNAKAISTLYWSSWARKNPDYYVLTVSPGGTRGTTFTAQESVGKIEAMLFPYFMAVMGSFGYTHPLEVGAKRYVDAAAEQGAFTKRTFESGTFVASPAKKMAGPVCNQFDFAPGYADHVAQDAAYEAVQLYV